MRARARAGTAAAAAAAVVGRAKAKKPKPKYSDDDHNRPDGVRWSDLRSGTAVMMSGNCPGVAAEPGEVVPATICDGSEQEMHPVTRDGQVSLAGGVFPNRDGRKLWVPFRYVVRVGHDLATESQDSRPRRQCSTPSPGPSRLLKSVATASTRGTSAKPKAKPKAPAAKRPRERSPTGQLDCSGTAACTTEQPKKLSGFQGHKWRQEAAAAAAAHSDAMSELEEMRRWRAHHLKALKRQFFHAVARGDAAVVDALLKIEDALSWQCTGWPPRGHEQEFADDEFVMDHDPHCAAVSLGYTFGGFRRLQEHALTVMDWAESPWTYPLHLAARNGQAAIIPALLAVCDRGDIVHDHIPEKAVYLNAPDSQGLSALDHAAEQGHLAAVKALLLPTEALEDLDTTHGIARAHGHEQIAALLRERIKEQGAQVLRAKAARKAARKRRRKAASASGGNA